MQGKYGIYRTLGERYAQPDWNQIRGLLMFQRGGKCEKCGAIRWLQAHHKTYVHIGDELHYMEDLSLLCKYCHATQHPHLMRQIKKERKEEFWDAVRMEGFLMLKQLKKSIIGH